MMHPERASGIFTLRFIATQISESDARFAPVRCWTLGRGVAEDWPEVALIKIRLNLSSICESSNIISTCT